MIWKGQFDIVYKNIWAYYVCTGKQMNPEHECNTMNCIFSNCNINTFNMVQLMEEDSDKDQINKQRLNSLHSLLIKYNMWQATEPRIYMQAC